jgi:TPR repeat protein
MSSDTRQTSGLHLNDVDSARLFALIVLSSGSRSEQGNLATAPHVSMHSVATWSPAADITTTTTTTTTTDLFHDLYNDNQRSSIVRPSRESALSTIRQYHQQGKDVECATVLAQLAVSKQLTSTMIDFVGDMFYERSDSPIDQRRAIWLWTKSRSYGDSGADSKAPGRSPVRRVAQPTTATTLPPAAAAAAGGGGGDDEQQEGAGIIAAAAVPLPNNVWSREYVIGLGSDAEAEFGENAGALARQAERDSHSKLYFRCMKVLYILKHYGRLNGVGAFTLGNLHFFGHTDKGKDIEAALEAYELAADQSHTQAMFWLGCIYQDGMQYVPVNLSRATQLFRAVVGDKSTAFTWRAQQKIVANKLEDAVFLLQIHAEGCGPNGYAYYLYADCLEHGLGIDPDSKRANEMYRLACQHGWIPHAFAKFLDVQKQPLGLRPQYLRRGNVELKEYQDGYEGRDSFDSDDGKHGVEAAAAADQNVQIRIDPQCPESILELTLEQWQQVHVLGPYFRQRVRHSLRILLANQDVCTDANQLLFMAHMLFHGSKITGDELQPNYAAAKKICETLIEPPFECAQAHYYLGRMHEDGLGPFRRNHSLAERHYIKAGTDEAHAAIIGMQGKCCTIQ